MSKFNFGSGGAAKRTFNIEHFRGCDMASSPLSVSAERSPDCVNLIPDKDGFPVCRPGARVKAEFDGRINGVHILQVAAGKFRLVHHGEKLSLWAADGTQTVVYEGMNNARSRSAQLEGKLGIFDGLCALLAEVGADGKLSVKPMTEAAYVPTTTIGRKAGAAMGGTALEAVNLLCDRRKNSFCVAEEGQTVLWLDSAPVKSVLEVRRLLGNGMWTSVTDWTLTETSGELTFSSALQVTPVSGMDNYEVEFEAQNIGDEDRQAEYTAADAAIVDEEGCVVWYWSETDKTSYATKYYFKLGESLPKESCEAVITVAQTYYKFQSIYDDGFDYKVDYPYPRDYAVTVTTEEQTVDLGWLSEYYEMSAGEVEAHDYLWAEEMCCEVQLVQQDGIWYLTVTEPHTGYHGGGIASRIYVRDLSGVQIGWRESGVNLYTARINGCTVPVVYGVGGNADRLFVTGNRNMPNMDWMSGFEDMTYWPDVGYTKVGSEATPVVGYSWLTDGTLAIHKEANGSEPTIWYRRGTLGADGEAEFSLTQGAVGVGAVSSDCFADFGDDNLCLSNDGVFAITRVANEVANERFAKNRSWYINPKLTQEENLREAQMMTKSGRCYLAVNGRVYVADALAPRTYEDGGGGYQYDWWLWESLPVRVWVQGESEICFGTENGEIMSLSPGTYSDIWPSGTVAIACHWLTGVLDLGSRAYCKKIKNAYVIAEPFNSSHAKLSYIVQGLETKVMDRSMGVFDFNNIDFADFGFETDDMPRNLASNAKAKKVMFVKFKIENEPGKAFGIYGLTVLYTVSGKYRG